MHAQISLVLMPGDIHGKIQVQFRCFVKNNPNYTLLSRHHLFNVKLVVITLYGYHHYLVLARPLVFMTVRLFAYVAYTAPPPPSQQIFKPQLT